MSREGLTGVSADPRRHLTHLLDENDIPVGSLTKNLGTLDSRV
ncbi:hypothetical protein ACFW9F_02240 [Streptomyces sp. NPDC059506]|nr:MULTISPECIES: hypothetical protein [unclassified Streptomyces]MCZ2525993.1 hypothetical protein [Streptomyces sp. HB2AG]